MEGSVISGRPVGGKSCAASSSVTQRFVLSSGGRLYTSHTRRASRTVQRDSWKLDLFLSRNFPRVFDCNFRPRNEFPPFPSSPSRPLSAFGRMATRVFPYRSSSSSANLSLLVAFCRPTREFRWHLNRGQGVVSRN